MHLSLFSRVPICAVCLALICRDTFHTYIKKKKHVQLLVLSHLMPYGYIVVSSNEKPLKPLCVLLIIYYYQNNLFYKLIFDLSSPCT